MKTVKKEINKSSSEKQEKFFMFGRVFVFKNQAAKNEFMDVFKKTVVSVSPDLDNGKEHKVIFQMNDGILDIKSGQEYLDGIIVELHDYDVEGLEEDSLSDDEDGRKYLVEDIY